MGRGGTTELFNHLTIFSLLFLSVSDIHRSFSNYFPWLDIKILLFFPVVSVVFGDKGMSSKHLAELCLHMLRFMLKLYW